MSKAVKLADIAEKVDVSIVTVSKALSGQKGVSEELRERIIKLADEMGYVPRHSNTDSAREPLKSYNIAVLIQETYLDKYDSFYWMMYQQVASCAMEKESSTMLVMVTPQMEENLEFPKLLGGGKADGAIIIGKLSEEYLAMLHRSVSEPIVYMDFSDADRQTDAVVSDNFYGGYDVTNYLISMGHTSIAYVGTLLATSSIMDRYLGYVKALLEHGLKPRDSWQIDDRDLHSGIIDEEKLLKLPKDMPSAFFCNCDLTAGKLINKLKREGYRVPEDVSVAGYDNYLHPDLCDVPITSYEVDFRSMAERSVKFLLDRLNKGTGPKGLHTVTGHLVVKESVRRLG